MSYLNEEIAVWDNETNTFVYVSREEALDISSEQEVREDLIYSEDQA